MRRIALGLVVDFADLSDPGRDPAKQLNEDACGFAETPLGLLSVVCDGMGGQVASAWVVAEQAREGRQRGSVAGSADTVR